MQEDFGEATVPYCYGAGGARVDWSRETSILALTGPGTAFGDDRSAPIDLDPRRHADLILLVESARSGLHWMQPGDFDVRTLPRTINGPSDLGISSRHTGGFHVLFGDLAVWFISNEVPFDVLERFFTVEGAKSNDREKLLGPYRLRRLHEQV